MQGLDSLMVEPPLAAPVDTRRFGTLDALFLLLLDGTPLHLGDHAEHGQDHVPHFAARRHVRVEHGDERTLLFALVNQVDRSAAASAFARFFSPAGSPPSAIDPRALEASSRAFESPTAG